MSWSNQEARSASNYCRERVIITDNESSERQTILNTQQLPVSLAFSANLSIIRAYETK